MKYKLVDGLVRPVEPEKPLQYIYVCRGCGHKNILTTRCPFDSFCWECGSFIRDVDGIAFEEDYK